MSDSFFTDEEINEMCRPLKSAAAQLRYLRRLGLLVNEKPNGRPLLVRAEVNRVLVGRSPEPEQNASAQPNRAALMKVIQGGKRGAQAQGR
jgi:hypothetical protein